MNHHEIMPKSASFLLRFLAHAIFLCCYLYVFGSLRFHAWELVHDRSYAGYDLGDEGTVISTGVCRQLGHTYVKVFIMYLYKLR